MTIVPVIKYAPKVSIHGEEFGLASDGYAVGKDLRGMRVKGYGAGSGLVQGQSYRMNPFTNVEQFDDFTGPVLSTSRWTALTGSDGSNSPVINLQSGGAVRLTTGAGSTHTMAVNGSQFCSSRNWLISNGGTMFEARIKVSALTSQSFCFGLIDAITLTAPFTRTTVTTTANGTNGACFLQDAASTDTKLYAVSVNAGGTPQSTALSVDLTTSYKIFRIEIDSLGNAIFYIDGLPVASQTLAVATTSVLAGSVGAFSEATSGSQTADVDYVLLIGGRV